MKFDMSDWIRVHHKQSLAEKYDNPYKIPKNAAQGKKNTKKGGKKK